MRESFNLFLWVFFFLAGVLTQKMGLLKKLCKQKKTKTKKSTNLGDPKAQFETHQTLKSLNKVMVQRRPSS